MSERELRAMIEHAAHLCKKHFAASSEIMPMWQYITAKGEQLTELHPPFDKDTAMLLIRMLFDLQDAVRYVYIGEAWTLERMIKPDEKAEIMRTGLSEHPDRVEVVVQLQGEDQDCGQLMAQMRIIRPANGKPYLRPLEWIIGLPFTPRGATVQSEGRMVGVLPIRGTRQ